MTDKNVAINLINERIEHLKRKVWKPITVLGDGDLDASKFAGKPWLNKDESWPTCPNCAKPMRFFFQLNLSQVPTSLKGKFGTGILQMFYCTNVVEIDLEHDAALKGREEGAFIRIGSNIRTGITKYTEIKSCDIEYDDYKPFSSCRLVRIIQPTKTPAQFEVPLIEDNHAAKLA